MICLRFLFPIPLTFIRMMILSFSFSPTVTKFTSAFSLTSLSASLSASALHLTPIPHTRRTRHPASTYVTIGGCNTGRNGFIRNNLRAFQSSSFDAAENDTDDTVDIKGAGFKGGQQTQSSIIGNFIIQWR